jgi:serine/threonine protein kinase HipA of HipAB toxin-antitoxin module
MTDQPLLPPVRVTAEERPHPALQKLARACIALAQLHRQDASASTAASDLPEGIRSAADPTESDKGVCHE